MPKTVEGVIQYLDTAVKAVVTTAKLSPFQYSTEKNSELDKFVYAVRPGSLTASTQFNQSMNVRQSFEVELVKAFHERAKGDTELADNIVELYDYHEKIFQRVSLRNSSDFQILNIEDFSSGSPDIDRIKKTVSLTFTYTIHYRKNIKEGA